MYAASTDILMGLSRRMIKLMRCEVTAAGQNIYIGTDSYILLSLSRYLNFLCILNVYSLLRTIVQNIVLL